MSCQSFHFPLCCSLHAQRNWNPPQLSPTGMVHSCTMGLLRAWLPLQESPLKAAGYFSYSYHPNHALQPSNGIEKCALGKRKSHLSQVCLESLKTLPILRGQLQPRGAAVLVPTTHPLSLNPIWALGFPSTATRPRGVPTALGLTCPLKVVTDLQTGHSEFKPPPQPP